jgi:hypothetical protein
VTSTWYESASFRSTEAGSELLSPTTFAKSERPLKSLAVGSGFLGSHGTGVGVGTGVGLGVGDGVGVGGGRGRGF